MNFAVLPRTAMMALFYILDILDEVLRRNAVLRVALEDLTRKSSASHQNHRAVQVFTQLTFGSYP